MDPYKVIFIIDRFFVVSQLGAFVFVSVRVLPNTQVGPL